jgi:glycosyltransferase involved in cell wall biosynthesis
METRKRILIISEAHLIKTFVQPTITRIKEETGACFDCFITTTVDETIRESLKTVFESVYVNDYPKGLIRKLPKLRAIQAVYGLRRITRKLNDYDIVHIHFYYYYYAFFVPMIRKKAKKLFVTFFGSDFYKVSNLGHLLNQRSLNQFDAVFATNKVTLQSIADRYKLNKPTTKIGTLEFLLNSFISFDHFLENTTVSSAKKMWHLENGSIVCGYSAGAIMQHGQIIDALREVGAGLSGYTIIFPMTYGWKARENKALVKQKLRETKFDSLVIEEYLPNEKLLALRLATDVMINVPSSDQFSASMLEHLAAGSVVITGKWLPYYSLVEKGVYFISVDKPQDLSTILPEVLDNLELHKQKSRVNREIILSMMKWDSIKSNWLQWYELKRKI